MEDNQLDLRDAAVSRVADNAAADTGLACLTLLARFYGIAADSAQLKHEFSPAGKPCGNSKIRYSRMQRISNARRWRVIRDKIRAIKARNLGVIAGRAG